MSKRQCCIVSLATHIVEKMVAAYMYCNENLVKHLEAYGKCIRFALLAKGRTVILIFFSRVCITKPLPGLSKYQTHHEVGWGH